MPIPDPDQGLDTPAYPDPADGPAAFLALMEGLKALSNRVYATTVERDAKIPTPTNGMVVYAGGAIWLRTGGAWVRVWPEAATAWLGPVTYGNSYAAYTDAEWQGIRSIVIGQICYVNGAFTKGTWTQNAICQLQVGHRPVNRIRGEGCEIDVSGNVINLQTGTGAGSVSAIFPII